MNILVIDTINQEVGLVVDDKLEISRSWAGGKDSGRKLMKGINEILGEKIVLDDLDRITVHNGPSKFTSFLRAAVTVANMLSLASDILLSNRFF